MLPETTLALAAQVLDALRARAWMAATAESCTGGLIAAALTHVAGASDVVDCGFVTYTNAAKSALLDVPPGLIAAHGAVSAPVAGAMAQGALARSSAAIAISVTGIAGPGGGSADKPVGLVWFGCALRGGATTTHHAVFPGGRGDVRAAAAAFGLGLLQDRAGRGPGQF